MEGRTLAYNADKPIYYYWQVFALRTFPSGFALAWMLWLSRHDCFKIHGDAHTHCQRQRCSPRSVVSGDIRLMPIFVGVRW